MGLRFINPESLGPARGYSNGVVAPPGGRLLFIAGQVAWDERQKIVSSDFAEQFERALFNLIAVVREAGGEPAEITRLVIYVTDKRDYMAARHELGVRWRTLMGRHFPAMSLVEVAGLLEDDAKVEIEGMAVLQ